MLIHGGASGIGTHAIQVARALGSRVAVTAGATNKLDLCAELGAEITINYRDEDFVERVRAESGGAGADVILDIMGAAYLDRNVDALAPDGRLVIIGMQGGVKGELNIGKLLGKARRRDRDGAAVPPGQRARQQERDRRRGGRQRLADDRRRSGAPDHRRRVPHRSRPAPRMNCWSPARWPGKSFCAWRINGADRQPSEASARTSWSTSAVVV